MMSPSNFLYRKVYSPHNPHMEHLRVLLRGQVRCSHRTFSGEISCGAVSLYAAALDSLQDISPEVLLFF